MNEQVSKILLQLFTEYSAYIETGEFLHAEFIRKEIVFWLKMHSTTQINVKEEK